MSDPKQPAKAFPVHGISIPAIGFGTFQSDGDNSRVKEAVLQALKCGYRHIDTAAAYGNEKEVGQAIKEIGIPRGEIFVTTKLAKTWHHPSDVKGALDASLKELQLEYVPHAYTAGPNHTTVRHPNNKPVIDFELSRDYPSTWKAMEELVRNGKTRLIAFCVDHNIHLTAHQALGRNPVAAVNPNADKPGPLQNAEVLKIAQETGYSPAQILIAWSLERGISVIPKTIHPSRMIENLSAVTLGSEHVVRIGSIAKAEGELRFLDPSAHIGFDIFSELVNEPAL